MAINCKVFGQSHPAWFLFLIKIGFIYQMTTTMTLLSTFSSGWCWLLVTHAWPRIWQENWKSPGLWKPYAEGNMVWNFQSQVPLQKLPFQLCVWSINYFFIIWLDKKQLKWNTTWKTGDDLLPTWLNYNFQGQLSNSLWALWTLLSLTMQAEIDRQISQGPHIHYI